MKKNKHETSNFLFFVAFAIIIATTILFCFFANITQISIKSIAINIFYVMSWAVTFVTVNTALNIRNIENQENEKEINDNDKK